MDRSIPTMAQLRRLIHTYRAVLVPIAAGIAYLGWVLWEVRGGGQLPGARLHTTILAVLGVAIVLLRPVSDKTTPAHGAGELQALSSRVDALGESVQTVGRQVDGLGEDVVIPLAADANRSSYTVKLVQGQLDRIDGSLQGLKSELADAVAGAYRKGLVDGAQGACEERTLSVINGENGSRVGRSR